ncbi:Mechanosensitive ion channel-domain-containing protein [Pelagophyceae sp. CCMP2097]|nr:Mechanosensitive ion channel-domain-containing protein [Pelagophyceae sp. CCMP2097]
MLCRRVFPALYAFDVCCTLLRLARAPVPRQLPWCVAALAYGACGSELLRALKRAGLARLLPLQLDKAAAAPLSKDEFDAQRVSWSNRLDTVDRIGDVVVWTASGLVLLEVLSVECGFALTSILAFGGVGSVVLGLACQTPLSNVVSGVLVALTNPFGARRRVGDEVLIGGGGSDELVGYVDQLGWYSTRLRGYDDRVIIIPNRLIDGRTAVNYSRMRHKRLNAELRLRPDDAPRVLDVVKKLRARIGTLPRVIDDRANNLALRVYLARYMDSSPVIDVEVHWEGNNKDEFFAWRERALVVVKDAIEDAGCQLFRPPVPPPPPKPPA